MLTFEPLKRPIHRRPNRGGETPTPRVTRAARLQVRRILDTPQIQPKLIVGPPDDDYEQEADRVADQVMRMPDPTAALASTPPRIQRMCKECEEEEQSVQRLPRALTRPAASTSSPADSAIVPPQTGGEPLARSVRDFFEPRFARDFSQVRVHADPSSRASALALNARAYAMRNHVVLGQHGVDLDSSSDRRLLAHELTHVVQQDGVASGTVDHIQRQVLVPDAAGGCGVCQGPQLAGETAHQLIQEEFEILYPLGLVELPFGSPTDENGRLDLAVATPRGLRIGEIKPANPEGYVRGAADMTFYLAAVRAAFPGTTVEPLTMALPPEVTAFPNGLPNCPTQMLFVNPPVDGIYGYYCEPPYRALVGRPGCKCRGEPERVPVPVPVPVPAPRTREEEERRPIPVTPVPVPARREALKEIADFVKRVVESGEDADRAAREFVQAHPELVALLVGAAVVIVVATILEDIATAGFGILDDPACFAVAYALVRAATAR